MKKFHRNDARKKSCIFRCFFALKAVVLLEGRTEQAEVLRQSFAHSLLEQEEAPAGHFAGFSTTLITSIVHVRGESEWNGKN